MCWIDLADMPFDLKLTLLNEFESAQPLAISPKVFGFFIPARCMMSVRSLDFGSAMLRISADLVLMLQPDRFRYERNTDLLKREAAATAAAAAAAAATATSTTISNTITTTTNNTNNEQRGKGAWGGAGELAVAAMAVITTEGDDAWWWLAANQTCLHYYDYDDYCYYLGIDRADALTVPGSAQCTQTPWARSWRYRTG